MTEKSRRSFLPPVSFSFSIINHAICIKKKCFNLVVVDDVDYDDDDICVCVQIFLKNFTF